MRRIVSSREIRIDHANWLNNGAIYLDDPVADISPDNDWSQVLVWNVETHAWGVHTYNVQGFIEPAGAATRHARLRETTADRARIAFAFKRYSRHSAPFCLAPFERA